jgi:ethanolamine utilization protein EutN
MFIAKVKGNVVTTQKVETMSGRKLLIVEPMRVNEDSGEMVGTGKCLVAVDSVGAGETELVLVTQGSSARMTSSTSDAPVDCVIIGIVDSVGAAGKTVFQKA